MSSSVHNSCGRGWSLPQSSFTFPSGSHSIMWCGQSSIWRSVLTKILLRLSHQRNDTTGLVLGHHSSGRTLFYRGRFASSRWHQEEALRLYNPISQRSLVGQAGFSPRVGVLRFLGLALFCLGFPDQALAQSNAAVTEARRLAHLPSLAVSLTLAARLLWLVGDSAALDEQADQLVAVTTEQGFPLLACGGRHLSRLGQGQKW
jgi:hypothetical protein